MNKQQRQEYSTKSINQYKRIERAYIGDVRKAIEEQFMKGLALVKKDGVEIARGKVDFIVFDSKIENLIRNIHVASGLFFANKGLREINKAVRMRQKAANFGFNDEWIQLIISYFDKYLLNKVVWPIYSTTKDRIKYLLDKAIADGWGYDKIAKEFENESEWMPLWRARMITRTETIMGANYGYKLAAEKSDYETSKEWIAANDIRTRHSHRIVDGELVDEDELFAVPIMRGKTQIGVNMMTGPGDPTAAAENIINCRCSLALVPRRDERGQLIPKQQLVTV